MLLCIPFLAEALEPDLEKELQQYLFQSTTIVLQARQKLTDGFSIDEEITKLKDIAESIRKAHTLLQERFRSRQEAVHQLGGKAIERQSVMEAGYLKALGEYLSLIESLQTTAPLTSPRLGGTDRSNRNPQDPSRQDPPQKQKTDLRKSSLQKSELSGN